MTPTISVIIPVYNAENTIDMCLQSVLKQKFGDFELILIDDGSTDRSYSICEHYAAQDSRILLLHQSNKGVSAARNIGLNFAKGKWITFIDSDDYVTNDYFDDVAIETEQLIIKSFNSILDEKLYENPFLEIVTKHDMSTNLRKLLEHYLTDIFFRGPCFKFFDRKTILGIEFPEDMNVGEDTYFTLLCLARIDSCKVLCSGRYIVRLTHQEAKQKYGMSVEKAALSLNKILEAYKMFNNKWHMGVGAFYSYIGYFKTVSMPYWQKKPSIWFDNKEIREAYKYVWKGYSLSTNIRILCTFLWFSVFPRMFGMLCFQQK